MTAGPTDPPSAGPDTDRPRSDGRLPGDGSTAARRQGPGPRDERPWRGPAGESPWAWQRWIADVPLPVSAFVCALVTATGTAAATLVVLVRPPSQAWPIAAATFAVTLVAGTAFVALASPARGLSAEERRAIVVA